MDVERIPEVMKGRRLMARCSFLHGFEKRRGGGGLLLNKLCYLVLNTKLSARRIRTQEPAFLTSRNKGARFRTLREAKAMLSAKQ